MNDNTELAALRDDAMADDEIALRAAINLLRDSVESGRMPSGESLTPAASALHERAAERLETWLHRERLP